MCLAVPGLIIELSGEGLSRRGRVDFSGIVREVSFACLPEASVGHFVIVHAGLALSLLDEYAASESLQLLKEGL